MSAGENNCRDTRIGVGAGSWSTTTGVAATASPLDSPDVWYDEPRSNIEYQEGTAKAGETGPEVL
jgi:hypothetical protein